MNKSNLNPLARISVLTLIAVLAAPAFAQGPPYCTSEPTGDGCDLEAYYDQSEDRTYWSTFCDDGFSHEGEQGGNQVPEICEDNATADGDGDLNQGSNGL